MVCGSSCGSGCDGPRSSKQGADPLDALLAAAAEAWEAPGAVAEESEGELARFSDIGQALAEGGGLSAMQPLATVFHEQGPQPFLKLAQALWRMGMRGPLLALAWSACGEDAARLCERAARLCARGAPADNIAVHIGFANET